MKIKAGDIIMGKSRYPVCSMQDTNDGRTWICGPALDDIKKVKLDMETIKVIGHLEMHFPSGDHLTTYELEQVIQNKFPEYFI